MHKLGGYLFSNRRLSVDLESNGGSPCALMFLTLGIMVVIVMKGIATKATRTFQDLTEHGSDWL